MNIELCPLSYSTIEYTGIHC